VAREWDRLVVTVFSITERLRRCGGRMKVQYDSEVDVLSIVFGENPVEESDEDKPGVILDYDKDGNIVGLGILDASKRMRNPRLMEYNCHSMSKEDDGCHFHGAASAGNA
jgi:uncharacterized protein YuzE